MTASRLESNLENVKGAKYVHVTAVIELEYRNLVSLSTKLGYEGI